MARKLYRVITETAHLPRVFDDAEKFELTTAELWVRCIRSPGWGARRLCVIETYDARLAYITYHGIRDNLNWVTWAGDETLVDTIILQKAEYIDGQEPDWEEIDHAAAVPKYKYYISDDGAVQSASLKEAIKEAQERGCEYINSYTIRGGKGWRDPVGKIFIQK